jgi:hypothetical protein
MEGKLGATTASYEPPWKLSPGYFRGKIRGTEI